MKKHLFVIRPDGDMTGFCGESGQKGGGDPQNCPVPDKKGGFEDQISELKRLLDDLPPERQDAFMDEIEGNE